MVKTAVAQRGSKKAREEVGPGEGFGLYLKSDGEPQASRDIYQAFGRVTCPRSTARSIRIASEIRTG